MKRKRNLITIVLFTIVFLCFVLVACGSEETVQNDEMHNIYQLYLGNGGDLSYEDWFATIKGEKGSLGANDNIPTIEINSDGYWVINGTVSDVKARGEQGPAGVGIAKIEKTSSTCYKDLYTVLFTNESSTTIEVDNNGSGHKYGEWTTILEGYCTSYGIKVRFCTVCNHADFEVENIAQSNHKGEWIVTKDVTCTENGEEQRECVICHTVERRIIPATGHKAVKDEAVEPSCTLPGRTEGSHCSTCGEVLVESEYIAPLGHTYNGGNRCIVCGVSKMQTPKDITYLPNIPNYSSYTNTTINYEDTTEQEEKLQAFIEGRIEEINNSKDLSPIEKILVHLNPAIIIEKMSVSGLSQQKMIILVDYFAGARSISDEQIETLVDSGTFDKNNTAGWSFFDDYTYYQELKNRANDTREDVDEDNVKRQLRNMIGKFFAMGISADEFARFVVNELEYVIDATEELAGEEISFTTNGDDTTYDTYMKATFDYETLIFLRAFAQYRYNSSTGFNDCVELVGYFFDYCKTAFLSQTDEMFEKQLAYSHLEFYTNAEWRDYMSIQRDTYTNAFRYDYSFYLTLLNKYFDFQSIQESQQHFVYGINGASCTDQMRRMISNDNLKGVLMLVDLVWCYFGDEGTMNNWNEANTAYKDRLERGMVEQLKEAEFFYKIERLKLIRYLMNNMTTSELSQVTRFLVYVYSSDMVLLGNGYNMDIALLMDGLVDPREVTSVIDGLTEEEEREYAIGKLEVLRDQVFNQYMIANVDSNAMGAISVNWRRMLDEIDEAINFDYESEISEGNGEKGVWERRVEKLEDLVIKKRYSCGAEIGDDYCAKTPETPHAECDKEYDANHKISLFINNYETILRHLEKKANVSFRGHCEANSYWRNDYDVNETATSGNSVVRTAGYEGSLEESELYSIRYEEIKNIEIEQGESFAGSLNPNGDDWHWWTGYDSKPEKANSEVIIPVNGKEQKYTYVYTFSGWYLDKEYKYLFDVSDDINCDLVLYAGYDLVKTRIS